MKKRIVLENLRSAYNVGNIFRTADALGRWVVLVGYTARPHHKWVKKTALWAEQSVPLQEFEDLEEAYKTCKKSGYIVSADLIDWSIDLASFSDHNTANNFDALYLVVWNELTGIEPSTLALSDLIVHIPMQWLKESLNVGQAAAIFMRELNQVFS